MAHLQTTLLTHRQRVVRLYKQLSRLIESCISDRISIRVERVRLRAEFDKHKDIANPAKATALLIEGEENAYKWRHPQPRKFAFSPGGINYERYLHYNDVVLDHWHPLEKAAYPKYFARRDIRKQEYIEWWEKKYGQKIADEM